MWSSPLIPVLATLLGVAFSIGLSLWRSRHAQAVFRAKGRDAIAGVLASRGETPVQIVDLPRAAVPERTGLATAVVFQVLARKPNGHETTYVWAYEPALLRIQPRGLKRLANGIWIPLT